MTVCSSHTKDTATQLVQVYYSIISPALEHTSPFWAALPQYFDDTIESVQKGALGIVIHYTHIHTCKSLALLLSLKEERKRVNFI